MFKADIKAAEGQWPYDMYDSILEKPNNLNPNQNAWLTLQLRVKLNFADSKNVVPGLTIVKNGKLFAKDSDGYLFPALDWPPHLIARFQREYAKRAEDTWNWQFALITPNTYSELDYHAAGGPVMGGWTVRPNVLCLFRMALYGPSGIIDTSPAAGPMRVGLPHRTINVVNLTLATSQVNRDPSLTPTAEKPATRNFTAIDGLSFRSNDSNYDDSDVFNPAWWQKEHKVLSNTVGHEVGHALGQCHIMGLKGDARYQFGGAKENDLKAYGVGSTNPLDAWNIMGGGDRVYLINAVSWQKRIAQHTGLPISAWQVTGVMNIPTRKLPGVLAGKRVAPNAW